MLDASGGVVYQWGMKTHHINEPVIFDTDIDAARARHRFQVEVFGSVTDFKWRVMTPPINRQEAWKTYLAYSSVPENDVRVRRVNGAPRHRKLVFSSRVATNHETGEIFMVLD